MKPEDVKIIQIIEVDGLSTCTLNGLGRDGHVYRLEYPSMESIEINEALGIDKPTGPYWKLVI